MQTSEHSARWLNSLRSRKTSALLVFLCSIAFLSFHLGRPSGNVLDEPHYVSGAKALYHQTPALWHGVPDTNPEHPPLAKYLIGLGVLSFGDNPIGWRVASVLFGSLTLALIFLWISGIADSSTAWLAVLLVATNGFWFVMSRVAMLSIFELFFCVAGFYAFTKGKPALAGLSLGVGTACRWNTAFAIAFLIAWLVLRRAPQLKQAFLLGITSCAAYTLAFLPAVRFHVPEFFRAQAFMLHYHRHFVGNALIAEKWYAWPLRTQPNYDLNFLVGNPVSIVTGAIAIVFLLATRSRYRLLALAPLVFWLQWSITGRNFQYYYYFLDCIVFLSIAAAFLLHEVRARAKWLPAVAVSLSVLWFLLHYPYFAYLYTPWDRVLNRVVLLILVLPR